MEKTRQQKQTITIAVFVDGKPKTSYVATRKQIEIDSFLENLEQLTEQHFN